MSHVMPRHITIMGIESSRHFSWALFWRSCDCECRTTSTAKPTHQWMQGGQLVCFANDAVAAHRVCLSDTPQNIWYFGKPKNLGFVNSVSERSKTVIWNLAKDSLAWAKASPCHIINLGSHHPLLLPIPSRYGPIPTPEITNLYNMVRALEFTNELFWWQISSVPMIFYLCRDYQVLNYCWLYWRNELFANPKTCWAKTSAYYYETPVSNNIATLPNEPGKSEKLLFLSPQQASRFAQ